MSTKNGSQRNNSASFLQFPGDNAGKETVAHEYGGQLAGVQQLIECIQGKNRVDDGQQQEDHIENHRAAHQAERCLLYTSRCV